MPKQTDRQPALNRRNILLGGSTLAAASAFGAGASVKQKKALTEGLDVDRIRGAQQGH